MSKAQSEKQSAFKTLIAEELKTLVAVLSTGERSVYAFVVGIEPPEKVDDEIIYRGSAFRWHTENLTRANARVALEALQREVKRIEELLDE